MLFHVDLSPGIQTHVSTLECLLALRSTCKRATLAIVFKPTVAKTLLDEHGKSLLCFHAVSIGDLSLLQFAVRRGCMTHLVCDDAAEAGHLHILKWAHEHGYPWNEYTCSYAARNGHLECLTYAHEHGCPWDEMTCAKAASGGQLECLAYAHEHGCLWDEKTCSYAAFFGQLECLTYAHEHGCPWDEDTCSYAARNDHLVCLAYAREHGCP